MAVWLAAIALLQGASAPLLEPHGPWVVAFEDDMCVASRSFGQNGEVTLAFRPSPFNRFLELTLLDTTRKGVKLLHDEKMQVSFGSWGPSREETYIAAPAKTGRVIQLYFRDPDLNYGPLDTIIAFQSRRDGPYRFHLREGSNLTRVLDACQRSLVKSWGIDPNAEFDQVVTPAKRISDPLDVRTHDYPADALAAGKSGTVTIVWTITTEGRAVECRVIRSSGVQSLDRTACEKVEQRARYTPSLDRDGRPVISHDMRSVVWIIPR